MATGPWVYNLAQSVAESKTQTAVARIENASFDLTKTQEAASRIQNGITKTQAATARIGVVYGPWVYNLAQSVAAANTQTATASIIVPGTLLTNTQTGVSRIVKTVEKTQPAIAAISNNLTKTQTATANISEWVRIATSAANSISHNDYVVVNGVTYQYRVASVESGVVGNYIYSNNITYTGSSVLTITQSATAKIAGMAIHSMMMGVNF